MEQTKDVMVNFRTTIRGKNSKGGDRYQFYISASEIPALIAALTANVENPNGVKFDIHVNQRTNSQNGRKFDSGFCFVKPVTDKNGAQQQETKTFGPKTPAPTTTTTKSKLDKLKQEVA